MRPCPYLVAFRAPLQGIHSWALEARFVEEGDAMFFIEAVRKSGDTAQREIFVTRKHYDFHAPLLPELKERFKDHVWGVD